MYNRATNNTVEEKAKLKRVLEFLKHTINYKRVLVTDNLIKLCTWVDAAYGVHPNLKSHIRDGMSLGYRILHCKFTKQKLNTKRSTESKIVSVNNYIPYRI